jgi:glucokinase
MYSPSWAPHPLEHLASGWAIEKDAGRRLKEEYAKSSLLAQRSEKRKPISTEDVAEAAKVDDQLSKQILMDAWHSLAEAICHVIALLCPRRIVIGGGVSLMGEELLFQPLRKLVAERVFKPFGDCYDIVPAALGEPVVVHGALALARKRLSR